ncbi:MULTISPECIES: phage tail protein [Pseudomonas]|uniref:phage tail-collar fiber domain-containing protein n=1 Tax=Pseudomonas TaxID=286 RepID=UPI001F336C7B|nr:MULTISPECIES: phage tail protein [Pseudomonas]MCX4218050.1 phage tail protein [Pseudomonas sp. MCal1]UIN52347.1 phage tail protein [Pseudomonas kribbensis]
MADYYTLLTNAGIAYETACKAAGLPIKLTQISVGDGGGAVYNPAATATALKREVWRGPLNALFQDEKNPSWLLAEVTIPPDVGGWYVREAGLWTDTGILYAIVKYPESFKPVLANSGSGKEFYIRSIFETSNASLVTLQIDDTVVKATRAWVMSYLAEELGKLDGKQSVRVAAPANVVLNGAQQIDGVAVIAGDRVLLPNQTLAKDNGLWVVANGDWTRANDANVSAKVTPGLTVMVEEGTFNGDSLWHLTTNAPITLGTTALTFKMLAGRTGIAAGTYKSLSVDEYGRATAGSNPDTLAGFGIKDSYTKAEVEALIAKASALPVGSIVAFPVDTPPPGFLELDNSVKSSATYPDLSAYLGGKFNKGDEGVGNFRLPEARGEFLRGWDHGRGVDAGRAIGSSQMGTVTAFDSNPNPNLTVEVVQATVAAAQADVFIPADYPGVARSYTTAGAVSSPVLVDGGVVRPRNIAVMWCIKAWNAPVNQGNIDVAALVKEVSRLGSAVPVGAVMAFPTGIVPPGFLELDGSVQSIATYPDLAAYLGTTYNKGDEGAGNFRLPESRGEFLRGWDHGRGVDPGRVIGSWAPDELKSHFHQIDAPAYPAGLGQDKVARGNRSDSNGTPATTATGGSETRPRSIAVMWCIKAWSAPINQGVIDIAALEQRVNYNEFGRLLNIQKFAVNGTYIPTPGMKKVRIRIVGGGGGSGGASATTASQTSASGGGAAGSYAETLITAADIGASQAVIVGAGGIAGTASGTNGTGGGAGGASSVGALLSAPGGLGSIYAIGITTTAFGLMVGGYPGASAYGGNIVNMAGAPGTPGITVSASTLAGHGGSGPLGSGGNGAGTNGALPPGLGYGGGGGGVAVGPSLPARNGAPGAGGVVIFEEYA